MVKIVVLDWIAERDYWYYYIPAKTMYISDDMEGRAKKFVAENEKELEGL